jgi:hypothetical protein
MNWAIWAKTRLPTPLSPLLERLPSLDFHGTLVT